MRTRRAWRGKRQIADRDAQKPGGKSDLRREWQLCPALLRAREDEDEQVFGDQVMWGSLVTSQEQISEEMGVGIRENGGDANHSLGIFSPL